MERRVGLFNPANAGRDFENENIVIQWPNVLSGSCRDLNDVFARAAGRINVKRPEYDGAFGPNSNSFAYTLLRIANLSRLIADIDNWVVGNRIPFEFPIGGTPFYVRVRVSPIPGWDWYLL